jgi:arylformamidase
VNTSLRAAIADYSQWPTTPLDDTMNLSIHLTTAASPMRHPDKIACPIAITSADEDSPEFMRPSGVFADALQGMGKLASRTVAFNAIHFQENDRLGEPDSEISRTLFALIQTGEFRRLSVSIYA